MNSFSYVGLGTSSSLPPPPPQECSQAKSMRIGLEYQVSI